eukprot:TRINITY_DN827_c1_g3_i2.p1 TRINITY_DN827_c1_g3~~TRINITY_DN827_c1_g3_i2.p1  ORF type:complete len:121 (-),score=14.78 TRINITY_DN827_c1_g3_i2:137-499(-)
MSEKQPLIQPPPYGAPPPPQNPGYAYPPQQILIPPPPPQVYVLPASFGESSVACVCPNCHKHVITEVHFVVGALTILISLIIFLLICWPCFWIPCVIDSLKDVEHRCPNCKWIIGKHKRL